MKLLGLNDISHFIAKTSKGDLTLQLRKGEAEYRLILDAVPVDAEVHDELMELLFAEDVQMPKAGIVNFSGIDTLPYAEMPRESPLSKSIEKEARDVQHMTVEQQMSNNGISLETDASTHKNMVDSTPFGTQGSAEIL